SRPIEYSSNCRSEEYPSADDPRSICREECFSQSAPQCAHVSECHVLAASAYDHDGCLARVLYRSGRPRLSFAHHDPASRLARVLLAWLLSGKNPRSPRSDPRRAHDLVWWEI